MIFYFSATGNTRWAATKLAKLLGEPLQPMTAVQPQESSDILGFCFPVHGWRLPKLVRDFVSAIDFRSLFPKDGKKPYVFVLLTCGDDCAQTIKYFNEAAEKNGIHVDAAFSLKMPESYVGLPFMDVDKKEKEQEKIQTAEAELPRIAELIKARSRNIYNVHEGACPWLKSKVIGGFFHSVLVTDKRFRLNEKRCIGCGRCEKVCPVGNLKLNPDRQPQWQHNGECMTCLACYHICPHHAIVFNRQTKNKGQYFFKHKQQES